MKKILFVLSLLITAPVFADTCATNLMPAFTSTQATAICTKANDSIAETLTPQSDNSIDVGTSSKGFRSGYFDTSVLSPLVIPPGDLVVRVDADAQRLQTIGASSDTALTYTFGDGGTTAVQQLTISASTADADDDSSLILAGGGANGGTRGASITLPGEEVAGGADITYNTGTGDDHIFKAAGTTIMTLGSTGALTLAGAGQTLTLPTAGGGGACAGTFVCNGATAVTVTTSCITTSSVVVYGLNTVGGTPAGSPYMFAVTNNTSFEVKCAAGDTSTMNWAIIKVG